MDRSMNINSHKNKKWDLPYKRESNINFQILNKANGNSINWNKKSEKHAMM